MLSKKIAILFVVSILLFASFSSIASARINTLKGYSKKDTGTIVLYKEKEEFIIEGHNGIVFLGKVFYKYLPLNLPEEFRKEGLKVKFTATISLKKIFTMDGLWHLIRGILPIELTSIKNIRELKVIAPPKIEEGKRFLVMVTDSTGEPVEKAMITVSWLKCVFYTNINGSVELKAPLVEKDAKHFISAAKEGYVWSEKEIIILNKKPILDFDIKVKESYNVDEPLIVKAILTNRGEQPIKLNIMCFEGDTLDFTIKTPDEKKLHYVGDFIDCYPPAIILKPGESHKRIIDLRDTNHPFGEKYMEPYNFTLPGVYEIKGFYHSFGKSCYDKPSNGIVDVDFWEGTLVSPVYKFEIKQEVKPGVIKGSVREDPEAPIFLFIPVEGAKIRAYIIPILHKESTEVPKYYETFTDSRGHYELEVEPGFCYRMVVTKDGYGDDSKTIGLIKAGEVKEVRFVLKKILDFDISLEKQEFEVGEPIIVTATLTNMGNSPIKVSSFGNDLFDITDSNGGVLDYIGPIGALPYPVILEPGKSISTKVDINKDYAYLEPDFDPANHQLPPRDYKIIGRYSSGPSPWPPDVNWTGVWKGNLVSPEYKFEILESQ